MCSLSNRHLNKCLEIKLIYVIRVPTLAQKRRKANLNAHTLKLKISLHFVITNLS